MRVLGAGLLGVAVLLAGCGSTDTVQAQPPAGTPTAVATPSSSAGGGTVSVLSSTCEYSPNPGEDSGSKYPQLPTAVVHSSDPVDVTLSTNRGDIVIELDPKVAPCTVNSFLSLVGQKYYDNTPCHRLLNDSAQGLTYAVLQCGDPTGTGAGGPGYTFADENLDGARYDAGVVAMANAGPNTNGSQFFMNFKTSNFDPNYTPFGKVISGLKVLQTIADGGTTLNPQTGANDVPKLKVTITNARVKASKG